jgi:hypothetical protein
MTTGTATNPYMDIAAARREAVVASGLVTSAVDPWLRHSTNSHVVVKSAADSPTAASSGASTPTLPSGSPTLLASGSGSGSYRKRRLPRLARWTIATHEFVDGWTVPFGDILHDRALSAENVMIRIMNESSATLPLTVYQQSVNLSLSLLHELCVAGRHILVADLLARPECQSFINKSSSLWLGGPSYTPWAMAALQGHIVIVKLLETVGGEPVTDLHPALLFVSRLLRKRLQPYNVIPMLNMSSLELPSLDTPPQSIRSPVTGSISFERKGLYDGRDIIVKGRSLPNEQAKMLLVVKEIAIHLMTEGPIVAGLTIDEDDNLLYVIHATLSSHSLESCMPKLARLRTLVHRECSRHPQISVYDEAMMYCSVIADQFIRPLLIHVRDLHVDNMLHYELSPSSIILLDPNGISRPWLAPASAERVAYRYRQGAPAYTEKHEIW